MKIITRAAASRRCSFAPRALADESAGPALRALPLLGHLRARRNRRLERHAAVELAHGELRDPQEQSRRDRPRHDQTRQAGEDRSEARRARHGVRRGHREHARRQAARAGRRGGAREDRRRRFPRPRISTRSGRRRSRRCARSPRRPELTDKPSEKDGVDFAILKMDHLDGKHVWGQVAKPHDPTNKKKYPGPRHPAVGQPALPTAEILGHGPRRRRLARREHRAARRDARSAQGVLRRAARRSSRATTPSRRATATRTTSSTCTSPTSARSTTWPAARTGTARRWWSWARAWAASKACAPRACIPR